MSQPAPNTQRRPQQPTPARRMTLGSVHKPRSAEAWSGLVYSVEGLGKTTLGASTPAPIFIAPESGFPRGVRPDLFPQPKCWNDLYDAVRELQEGQHPFNTLVFDTLDWLQPLLFAHIMRKNNTDSMEKVGGGYGRGYDMALTEVLRFLGVLETLRQTKNMNILFLAHAEVGTFKNPFGPDFDHWEPKLQKKISAKIREWCHFVLFGNFEVVTVSQVGRKKKDEDENLLIKGKAVNGAAGVRTLYTTLQPLFKAKNRHGMPDKIAFDWDVVARYLDDNKEEMAARCDSLRRQVLSVLEQLVMDDEKRKQATAWANGVKVPNLLEIGLNRMMGQLEDQQEEMDRAAAADEALQRRGADDLGEDMAGGFAADESPAPLGDPPGEDSAPDSEPPPPNEKTPADEAPPRARTSRRAAA